MNRSETGKFLYRYFRKLIASFQSSLYKAAITCDIEDIHKARVDVKKMNALFILFNTAVPGFSKETGARRLFKDLFNKAGTIREIQLILLSLEKKNDPDPVLFEFHEWLLKRNQIQIRQYLKSITNFDRNKLKDLTRSVKKLVNRVSKKQLIINSWEMIDMSSLRVKYLLTGWNDPRYIHRIRQNVKAISAIASQVFQVAPTTRLNQLRIDLTSAEIAIGEWHDRIVIISTMERFMKTTPYSKASSHVHFLDFKDQLMRENEAVLEKLEPEIKAVVLLIKSIVRRPTHMVN
jgi:CHAD domain-containing protein